MPSCLAVLPLILSISLAMGFDSLTALGIAFGSTGAGIASGCTNVFTVGVAQGIVGHMRAFWLFPKFQMLLP